MRSAKSFGLFIPVLILLTIAGAVAIANHTRGDVATAPAEQPAEAGEDADAVEQEAEEEEEMERSADAHVGSPAGYQQSNKVRVIATAAAAGWAGESQVANEDTWEPSIAADPSAPYVYVMYNRYGPACGSSCPNPAMMFRVSSDNGATWGPERLACSCAKVQGQWDPVLQTTANGAVYGTWMNYSSIVFSKSTDHGATWTTPVKVSGNSWADKPWMGVSRDGRDVYIAYESRSVLLTTASHDFGATWSAPAPINSDKSVYRYPNGLSVLPNGTAVLALSKYPGGSRQTQGQIDVETWRTTNGGTSWTKTLVTQVFSGVSFLTSSTTTIAADAAGSLVLEYSGATSQGGNGHVWVRRSTDAGASWSAATELFNGSADASFPAITAGAAGNFRLTWMDRRGGAWNVWYAASTNGGTSWSAPVDISDASAGASYKSAAGFASPYGDYDATAINSAGKVVSASGQGASFSPGPGGIWFNRQT